MLVYLASCWFIRRRLSLERRPVPTLFRLFFIVAVLVGLGYAAMFALVAFVEPQPREMSHTISSSKLK